MATLLDLYQAHIAASHEKQLHLAEFLGEHNWHLDLDAGAIDFGKGRCFPVQVLGTESQITNTWLWAWANEASQIPEPLLQASLTLRRLGQEQGIPELVRPEIPLGVADGGYLAAIASGVCDSDGFYRGPYDQGAVLVLLNGLPSRQASGTSPALRATTVFSEVIMYCDVDHRAAFEGYMRYKGARCHPDGDALVCSLPHGEVLRAQFDGMGRLANLEAAPSRDALSNT